MKKPNKVKQLLKSGKVAFGTCVYSFCPNIVEIAGYCGFDFCRIDNEHAWRQDDMLENMIRASKVADINTFPRIDGGNPDLVMKVLNIGADGFIIPHIKNDLFFIGFIWLGILGFVFTLSCKPR